MRNLVTIGIPVYNAEDYVEDMILSALGQTYPYIEILIVDDCGTDGSIDIVNKLQQLHPRGNALRILHNESNRGVGFSRNRIIDEAQGRFLYFLDSDDIIDVKTISLLMKQAREHDAEMACQKRQTLCKEDFSRCSPCNRSESC